MYFIGDVVTKWLHTPGADRSMELVDDFSFVDPKAQPGKLKPARK